MPVLNLTNDQFFAIRRAVNTAIWELEKFKLRAVTQASKNWVEGEITKYSELAEELDKVPVPWV